MASTVLEYPDSAPGLRERLAKPVGIYPRRVSGRFRNIKWAALVLLLGVYYLLPWIRWDRGPAAPDQAILVDMAGRRLYFFWLEIWPQEVYFLTGLLVLAAFGLFLATALFGRVWCGFACPQTVWTDLFLWVERLIEGDRLARMRLDRQPPTAGKAIRKTIKHAAWLLIAFATGGAWVMYFNDAPTVVRDFFTGTAGPVVYGFVGLFTATTYLLAGWAREQVCTTMCPWPRIQGGLLDQDSLAVTYRAWRGEPRGPHKKGASWAGRGDCIDCEQCVVVCPTGVDIRDGLQLGCIGCGLCIDACNNVMAKVDRPPFLIAWDSARNQELLAAGQPASYRLLRPRTVTYAALLLVVAIVILFGLGARAAVDINILPERNPLYVTLSDGSIRNGYTMKILNKSHESRTYDLTVEGLEGATLSVVGQELADSSHAQLAAGPDTVTTYRIYVTALPAAVSEGSQELIMALTDRQDGATVRHKTVFRGPER